MSAVRDYVIHARGMLRDFRRARTNTRAACECIFALSGCRATSQVHGSRNPAQENHLVIFCEITIVKQRFKTLVII